MFQGFDKLPKLKELYLSQNGIQKVRNLQHNLDLEILDLNFNRLEKIENVSHLQKLTDFWARQNKLSDFKVVTVLMIFITCSGSERIG